MDEKNKKSDAGFQIERVKLLVTIVGYGKGDAVIEELKDIGITYNLAATGEGIVDMGFAGVLGMGENYIDVVISVVRDSMVEEAMSMIDYVFHLEKAHTGICFAVPIEGVNGSIALQYLSGIF
jgi:uncharacterized protein YaaQ